MADATGPVAVLAGATGFAVCDLGTTVYDGSFDFFTNPA